MGDVVVIERPAMSVATIDRVRALETFSRGLPQTKIATIHTLHAGLYGRTIMIPADTILTGALIKIATVLIVSGHVIAVVDDVPTELIGYKVIPARPYRKAAFLAKTDTHMTMLFASKAKTVEEAEAEFTDEADLLFSRLPDAENVLQETFV